MPNGLPDYEEAAKSALALAERCEDLADKYDAEWKEACERDAIRHRERAAWYLERKEILEAPVSYA